MRTPYLSLALGFFIFCAQASPASALFPSSGALSLIRSMAVTVPSASCGATPVPGATCCPGLTSLNGFVASGGMILDNSRHRLYAADFENNRIQVFDSQTFAALNLLSFMGAQGALNLPVDAALDADGNLYVADLGNEAVEKFDANYNFVGSIAAGKGLSIVGVWAEGSSVYFAAMQNYIYRYTGSGASYSAAATFGSPAYLNHPNEIIKVGDWLYVTDTYNNRVVKFDTNNPGPVPTLVKGCLLIPTGIRTTPGGDFIVEESNNGSYPAYVDIFSPDFATLKSRCAFADTWSAVEDQSGKMFISGMNSFSVTVLQSCGSASSVPTAAPTATPLPPPATPTVTPAPATLTPTPVLALSPTATPVVLQAKGIRALPNVSKSGQPIQFNVNLTQNAVIRLSLFTPTGELVYQTQVSGEAGANNLTWFLKNRAGIPVASGLYIYVIQITGAEGNSVQRGQVMVLH
jgi:hypothetical protein